MSIDYAEFARLVRKGRKAERRGKVIRAFITNLIVSILGALFGGWMLMLAVGIAHHDWVPGLPTIGYWWSALLVSLLRGVFSRPVPTKTADA